MLVPRIVLAVLLGLLAASRVEAQEVVLSVAVSLKDAVEEIGRGFTAARPGVTLRYNFGASGDLQKQIEAGAPVDGFLSAAQRQVDDLEKQGLIVPETRRAFARNVLVAIKPSDSTIDLTRPADLLAAPVRRNTPAWDAMNATWWATWASA